MPIPFTKIYISSAIFSGDAFEFLSPEIGDISATVIGSPAAPWIAGVTDLNGAANANAGAP